MSNQSNNSGNKNFLSKLFSMLNWEVKCECCGSRVDNANFEEGQAQNETRQQQGRSTATSERSKQFMQGVHKLDENYLNKLLEGFKESVHRTCPNGPIKKKKKAKEASPKWNQELDKMLRQSVAMYGTKIDLIHAFFPGFGKDFLNKKLKKIQRVSKKKSWNDTSDKLLAEQLIKTGGNFQAVAPHFLGRTLEDIKERTEILKSRGIFDQYLPAKTGSNSQLRTNNGNGGQMAQEAQNDGAMMAETNYSNQIQEEGTDVKQNEFEDSGADNINFSLEPSEPMFNFHYEAEIDPTPKQIDFFKQSKAPSSSSLNTSNPIFTKQGSGIFDNQGVSMNGFQNGYDKEITDIFGSGFDQEDMAGNDGMMQEEPNKDFNSFIDMDNSGSFRDPNSQAGSPYLKMHVRPINRMNTAFTEKMM